MAILNKSTVTGKYVNPDQTETEFTVESNESSTEYMTESFSKVKSSSKNYATKGEELTQTITLTNNSQYPITNIRIKDTLDSDATITAGSVEVDGVAKAEFDPVAGFELEDELAKSAETVITYKITINEDAQLEIIHNKATITYDVNEITDLEEDTNTVEIQVVNGKLELIKTSDKSAVISGNTLTFMIEVKNSGNSKATGLTFRDPIPTGTKFVENSVKIDEVVQDSFNPDTGFALSDLDPGQSIKVSFDVMVDWYEVS